MKKIRLVKIEERSDATHPNNIQIGEERIGYYFQKPEIGKPFIMRKEEKWGCFITSPITEIIDGFTFKTLNSIYKIEYI